MNGMPLRAYLPLLALALALAAPGFADDNDAKNQKAKEAFKKKALKQLGAKNDGFYLLALEETMGPKVVNVTITISKGPETAADDMANFMYGGSGKQIKRTVQVIARLEDSEKGESQAKAHQKQLQHFVGVRMEKPVFSRDACYSDLDPSNKKSINQGLAEGTIVRYYPLR